MMQPRGVRNSNPLNIRKGQNWKGEASVSLDRSFETFESLEYGFRAGLKLLRNYITGHNSMHIKYNTLFSIIPRWAPPSENATLKYIKIVSARSGISPYEVIDPYDKKVMCQLARAMAFVECGQMFDLTLIQSAYDLL